MDAATDDSFSRPVLVDQASCRRVVAPQLQTFGRKVFTTDDEQSGTACGLIGAKLLGKQKQMRRRDLDEAAPLQIPQRRKQVLAADIFLQQFDLSSRDQRRP